MYFSVVYMKRKRKLWESPAAILYLTTMLMWKLRNSIHPNHISLKFVVQPPSLKEYIT